MSNTHHILLFDLGGVLLELGQHPVHPDWFAAGTQFSIQEWFHSEVAIAFEQGHLSATGFAEAIINGLQLKISTTDLLNHFAGWINGTYPEVIPTLTSLKERYTLAFLSNTNEVHWPRITGEFGFDELFTYMFASHLLQMSKPDPMIFRHVLQEMDTEPQQVLFYDDNPANIDAARKLGIDAVLVKGFNAVLDDLTTRNIITRD